MILKPFMLRRIKKDVENELGDKVEVEVSCALTSRQRRMYSGLKGKISVKELLEKVTSLREGDSEGMDSLMNLVIQFRKVCNHPELFERADVVSPVFLLSPDNVGIARGPGRKEIWEVPYAARGAIKFVLPKRLWRLGMIEGVGMGVGEKIKGGIWNVFGEESLWRDIVGKEGAERTFSFLRLVDLGIGEYSQIVRSGLLRRWVKLLLKKERERVLEEYYRVNDLR